MCKPVSTPTALSSAAVTQDMNSRMMEFVAVVMGFSIGGFHLYEGHGIGGAGPGLPLQVFPLFSQKHLQFGTFPSAVGSQPHKTEMSHFLKGGVESHFPCHLTPNAKPNGTTC